MPAPPWLGARQRQLDKANSALNAAIQYGTTSRLVGAVLSHGSRSQCETGFTQLLGNGCLDGESDVVEPSMGFIEGGVAVIVPDSFDGS